MMIPILLRKKKKKHGPRSKKCGLSFDYKGKYKKTFMLLNFH